MRSYPSEPWHAEATASLPSGPARLLPEAVAGGCLPYGTPGPREGCCAAKWPLEGAANLAAPSAAVNLAEKELAGLRPQLPVCPAGVIQRVWCSQDLELWDLGQESLGLGRTPTSNPGAHLHGIFFSKPWTNVLLPGQEGPFTLYPGTSETCRLPPPRRKVRTRPGLPLGEGRAE